MVSILIVNYRCWEKLSACLDSLLTEHPDTLATEIIVVDNQSNDGKMVAFSQRYPTVRFIENAGNLGFANGCNLAANHATGEVLLFLNPDTLVTPGQLSKLLSSKKELPQVGLLSCRQLDGKGRNQRAFGYFDNLWTTFGLTRAIAQRLFPEKYPSPRADLKEITECDWISGSVVMVERHHYDLLGGWDDSFWMYCEDVDLCKRAWQNHLKVAYNPNVAITHLHGGASRSSSETKALTKSEVIISKHNFVRKHSPSWLSSLPGHSLVLITRTLPVLLAGLLTAIGLVAGKKTTAVRKSKHLLSYYALWIKTGDSRSPRARYKRLNQGINNP
ncbi:MAG: glycosyltransferase family 2 protein [Gammaproteobacteria bacterium]|nr:glycosyltransferase family 2 protein [Gammaproteobacteria bacterium]